MQGEELSTPAAIVDLDVAERNCARMRERMAALGVRLRPHVKTHKTVEGALLQCGGAPGPITVSTLAEARFFAAAGFGDITFAVPVAPGKLPAAAELVASGLALHLLVDDKGAAAAVEACAEAQGVRFSVFLKVDCGAHRCGVDPERDEGRALAARLAQSERVEFAGILTHAGQAYGCRNTEEIRAVAAAERDVMVRFARRLAADGIEAPEVSIGSTPTMSVVNDLSGITEARPGNYIFFDAFQAAIGACAAADCAFSVLATVIGCYRERRTIVIDAGALALSKDAGARHVDGNARFGAVCSADGARSFHGLRVASLSQEHAVVAVTPPLEPSRFPVGTRLRIVPNHSCLAAARFDRYHVVRGGTPTAEWRPVRGW